MSEKQTDPFADTPDFQPNDNDPFIHQAGSQDKLVNEASQRAKAVIAEEPNDPNKHSRLKQSLALVGAGAAIAGGIALASEVADAVNGPEYASETTTAVIEKDLWSVLDKIKGIDSVDRQAVVEHIVHDPANINVFLRDDGTYSANDIQPGQVVVIPVSVEK